MRSRHVFLLDIGLIAVCALMGCTAIQRDEAHRYAYMYCRVRDNDPIVHQTVDAMIPVAGGVIQAGVSTACVVIESYSPVPPKVTSIVRPAKEAAP